MEPRPPLLCVVDDDGEVRQLLQNYFESCGFEVISCENGDDFLRRRQRRRPDLAILDIMMPGTGGFQVLQQLRDEHDDLPVIVLTSRSDRGDRIAGLDLGADDYVAKPFDPDELLARVRAVLRRRAVPRARMPEPDESVQIGCCVLDPLRRTLTRDGQTVNLMPSDFALLRALSQHPLRPMSRERLLELTAGTSSDKVGRSIDVQIRRLRQLVEKDPEQPVVLQTVRGVGYVFVP